MSEQGWKKRRALAGMRKDDWNSEEKLAVRAERQRMQEEADAVNRAAVEASDTALTAAECRCTACGGTGMVKVEKAAAIVEALHSYGFQNYRPSKAMVAALDAIARGIEVPGNLPVIAFTYGSYSPAPSVAVASSVPAPSVVMQKPTKPTREKPDQMTSDGLFLIETD